MEPNLLSEGKESGIAQQRSWQDMRFCVSIIWPVGFLELPTNKQLRKNAASFNWFNYFCFTNFALFYKLALHKPICRSHVLRVGMLSVCLSVCPSDAFNSQTNLVCRVSHGEGGGDAYVMLNATYCTCRHLKVEKKNLHLFHVGRFTKEDNLPLWRENLQKWTNRPKKKNKNTFAYFICFFVGNLWT